MFSSRDFLHAVDLDKYFTDKGFLLLKRESSQRWRKYVDPATDIKYLVTRNATNGHYLYNCPQADDTYKNIFDFVREYEHVKGENDKHTSFLIIERLNAFLGRDMGSIEKVAYVPPPAKSAQKPITAYPLYDFNYLVQHRKIDRKTIENPLIKGTLFNTIYKNNTNTAFAKRSTDGTIKGYEIYYQYNGQSGSLVSGTAQNYHNYLWHSNVLQNKPVSHVFVGESGKDALAYLEHIITNMLIWNSGKNCFANKDFNPLLISIGGNLTSGKETQLQLLFEKYDTQKTQYISICDNDKAGEKYDKILSALVKDLFEKQMKTHKPQSLKDWNDVLMEQKKISNHKKFKI